MSKKGVEFTLPSGFKILIYPDFSTTKSLSSPAFLISTGLLKEGPKDSKITLCEKLKLENRMMSISSLNLFILKFVLKLV